MHNLDTLRSGMVGGAGAVIGLLILALAPALLRQNALAPEHLPGIETRLLPLKEEIVENELEGKMETEPPLEPVIQPDSREIEAPEVQLPEIDPPPIASESMIKNQPLEVSLPALGLASLNDMQIAAGHLSAPLSKAALPSLPEHRAPRIRFNADEVDRRPQGVATMQPMYPYRAKRLGIEGAVTIRFLVDRTGGTSHIEILRATPPGEFEQTVEKTVKRWKFKPAVKDGRTVETWVETAIVFKTS